MSARAGPTIAEPVSCAIIRRSKLTVRLSLASGRPAWIKNGVPYTCSELSTAIQAPGVSGTRWAPTASRSSDNPAIRKKHKRSVLASHFLGALRICTHPLTDALERHLRARDDVALDKNAADRNVRVSVVGIVGDPQH